MITSSVRRHIIKDDAQDPPTELTRCGEVLPIQRSNQFANFPGDCLQEVLKFLCPRSFHIVQRVGREWRNAVAQLAYTFNLPPIAVSPAPPLLCRLNAHLFPKIYGAEAYRRCLMVDVVDEPSIPNAFIGLPQAVKDAHRLVLIAKEAVLAHQPTKTLSKCTSREGQLYIPMSLENLCGLAKIKIEMSPTVLNQHSQATPSQSYWTLQRIAGDLGDLWHPQLLPPSIQTREFEAAELLERVLFDLFYRSIHPETQTAATVRLDSNDYPVFIERTPTGIIITNNSPESQHIGCPWAVKMSTAASNR